MGKGKLAMRFSEKHKLVFFSIPKTGSLSGWTFMEEEFGAASSKKQHSIVLPESAEKYRKFTFIRNPYTRFMSIYHAIVILGGPRGKYKRNYFKITKGHPLFKSI